MLHASPSSFVILPALAKIVCEPGWKWQKREKSLQNYDLFYVWSGEGTVVRNDEPFQVGKEAASFFVRVTIQVLHIIRKSHLYLHIFILMSPKR